MNFRNKCYWVQFLPLIILFWVDYFYVLNFSLLVFLSSDNKNVILNYSFSSMLIFSSLLAVDSVKSIRDRIKTEEVY